MKFCSGLLLAASSLVSLQLIPCVVLHAQTPLRPDYSRESAVFEHMSRVFRYNADGTGSREITGVIDINNSAAVKGSSVLNFPFASSAEHVEIEYVRVRRPDGTIIVTPASDAQELPAPVTREAPFYSDLKEEQVPVRSLREGDHLEYKLRIVRTRAEAPGHFWGQETFFKPSDGMVIFSEDVELHVPKASFVQVWSPTLKSSRADTADEQVYLWHSAQLLPVAGKTANALLLLDNPSGDKIPLDGEPKPMPVAWTNFHSWAEVGAWYRSMEGHRVEPDDAIRAKVKELTAGKLTPDAKAQAVYAYDSAQIRYIGVAFGIGRYQPHEASEVLSNQYGDCKDKHTLLASMLDAAGIPADAVLIGQGIAFNEAVPSPGAFNHAITLAHIDGKPVWLDATFELAPYRLLNSSLRGKKALVIPLNGEAHIETTPTTLPFASTFRFEAVGTLDDQGTSHSHIVMDFRNDDEVSFRQAVRAVSRGQWDELMQNISQAMGYSGKVSNAEFSRADDTSKAFRATYDYEREKSGDWPTLRIIPQVPPIALSDVDEKDPTILPIDLGEPHVDTAHAVITLPKGWSATLPDDIHAKSSFATLDKTYKLVDGAVVTDRRFEVLQQKVPASNWRAYHAWYKAAGLSEGEYFIQLINPSAKTSSSNNNNDMAQELIRQANAASEKRDWPAALAALDKAKAVNPKQPYLWSNYGYVAMGTGKMKDAIKDYRREIAAYPEEPNAYSLLATVYMQEHKTDEAVTVLRSSFEHRTHESLVLQLVYILTQAGDVAGAVKVLRDAHTALPDDLNIQMGLGSALIHMDSKDDKHDGEIALLDGLKRSEDPGQLNNVAYDLTEAAINPTVDLPAAEAATRHALDVLDTATDSGAADKAALSRADLLVSTWDTLGWILFKQGKTADAETWIRAAWRNGYGSEPGYHLALIYQKEGHLNEALSTIELAAAMTTTSIKQAMVDLLNKLEAAGAKTDITDPMTRRQEDQTYILTTSPGPAWATLELDATSSGIGEIKLVEGDKSILTLSDKIRALKLDLAIPAQSHATLVRHATVTCQATCKLVMLTTVHVANAR